MAQLNERKEEKKSLFARFLHGVSSLTGGTSSNVEELEGRLLSVVRDLPLCGQTPWKLREVERLLAKGAPIAACSTFESFTALHYACQNNDVLTAKLLIRHGICVNAQAFDGSTPLHTAVSKAPDMIELLYLNGADMNGCNNKGETALHVAAMLEDPSSARSLISLGVNLFVSANSRTVIHSSPANRPLVYALRSGRLQLILLFLQCGDSFEDFSSRSVLSYGYSRCISLDVIKLLVEAGLKVSSDLFESGEWKKWPDTFIEWLINPLPLHVQCMKSIRHSVGAANLRKIKQLHLPPKLKSRLMYELEGVTDVKGSNDIVEIKSKQSSFSYNIYGHFASYNE